MTCQGLKFQVIKFNLNCNNKYRARKILNYVKNNIRNKKTGFRMRTPDVLLLEINIDSVVFNIVTGI